MEITTIGMIGIHRWSADGAGLAAWLPVVCGVYTLDVGIAKAASRFPNGRRYRTL